MNNNTKMFWNEKISSTYYLLWNIMGACLKILGMLTYKECVNSMNVDSYIPGPPAQPDNPTDIQRQMLTRYALLQKGRLEDFEYIQNLTAPPQDITTVIRPGELNGVRIGIIGAGLAGLASAFELRKTGAEITVFEAEEKRIGGRVYTYYFDKSKRLYGELGAMRIPVSHETVWHYINLFKLPSRPFVQNNENALIYLKDTRVRNDADGRNVMKYIYPKYRLSERERKTPWQQLVYYGLESPLLPANPEQRSELLQVKPTYNNFTKYWDCQSNRSMMESLGLSQGAIDLISNLSPLAGQNLYNSYVDIAQANYPANLSFLYEIPGGTSAIPYAMYHSLLDQNPIKEYPEIPSNLLGKVDVKNGSWVTGIYRDDKTGKVKLAYGNRKTTKPRHEIFDYVICAIPFSTLRTIDINPLFSNVKMQAIKEVTYIAAQKTLMLCNKRFWEEGGPDEQIIGGGSYTDLPITTLWYPTDHSRYCHKDTKCMAQSIPYDKVTFPEMNQRSLANEPGVMIASYCYGQDSERLANMLPELRIEEIKREVEEVHGLPKGYLNDIAVDFKTINWNDYPWSRGALPFFSPEQKRLFSYGMALPEYDNRVFMAGEHISAVHRWMQGALQSGMIAANQLAMEFRNKESRKW
ncbi:MAG: monoamine oxidase [Clostridia bacterium]|jgi:monoamine oxidase|nr:monoamine oxidase [Clostridia bacterium]